MKDTLFTKFNELYGSSEDVGYYFSPGRVNLIGEHTDYNGGHVFPCSLTLGTYGVVKLRTDKYMQFYSMNLPDAGIVKVSLDDLSHQNSYGWANYPLGMVWALKQKGHLLDTGFDLLIWGDIPSGSGLSSSASLEVLVGLILKELYHFDALSMIDVALLGQYAENNFNGMNCGIMDQFTVAMGKKDHAIFLSTSDLSYEYVPIQLNDASIIITNSNVSHSLVDSKYNERRQECTDALTKLQKNLPVRSLGDLNMKIFDESKYLIQDEIQIRRAKHAVSENQRTIDAVTALKNNNIIKFGELMNQSHISLRDDYEVSCKEIDVLVDLALKVPGVLGSRITGGGFGGCTVSIVKKDAIPDFIKAVGEEYKASIGHEANFYPVDIGDGARKLPSCQKRGNLCPY
ncbi:galactokinase [Lachnospiraceae bacterium ZAX-1]